MSKHRLSGWCWASIAGLALLAGCAAEAQVSVSPAPTASPMASPRVVGSDYAEPYASPSRHPDSHLLDVAFESRACSLPCWNGLVPGQTTYAEAQRDERLAGAACHDDFTASPDLLFSATCSWDVVEDGWDSPVLVLLVFGTDESRTLLSIRFGQLNARGATFGGIAERLGPPEGIRALRIGTFETTCVCEQEATRSGSASSPATARADPEYAVLYPSLGLIAEAVVVASAESWPCVCEEMEANLIRLEVVKPPDMSLRDWYYASIIPRVYEYSERFDLFAGWGNSGGS